MAIWFCSDTHFGHRNLAEGESRWESGHRPFATVDDMDECLIERINMLVRPNDTLYHLGDFTMGNRDDAEYYRNKINCRTIHLIFGNHDVRARKSNGISGLFASLSDYKEIQAGGQHIVLCHYPFASWNRSHWGSWHLHGHVHGVPMPTAYPWRLDVGVDTNHYYPYSLQEVEQIMSEMPSAMSYNS